MHVITSYSIHYTKLYDSRDPAEEVKKDKSEMAEPVFDIVTEDPEVEHIAEDMENAAMHEHGGEER